MFTNYHTHTTRCRHATGTEREYIEAAIARGFDVLGFADHAPMPFENGYCSSCRMYWEQRFDYVETLKALREEYKDRIQILIGAEAEYYPQLFPTFLEEMKRLGVDYLILGQHYTQNEYDGVFAHRPSEDPEILRQYVDQVITGLSSGAYLYPAHPDMIDFRGDETVYTAEMTRLCEYCKQHDFPLEINMLGIQDHRNYPEERFWKIAGAVGNTAIIGHDAHNPGMLDQPEALAYARSVAERNHIPLVDGFDDPYTLKKL